MLFTSRLEYENSKLSFNKQSNCLLRQDFWQAAIHQDLKMASSVLPGIVGKKWDPGILDPSRFSAQIRKVEARLGKLVKIRKVETD